MAGSLIHGLRPGDFNQALMEFGALVCTPAKPACADCTLKESCFALLQTQAAEDKRKDKEKASPPPSSCATCGDIEEAAGADLAVTRYPQKVTRKKVREETYAVAILERKGDDGVGEVLLMQRPNKGLLSGLWEFPSVLIHTFDPSASSAKEKDSQPDEIDDGEEEKPPSPSLEERTTQIAKHLHGLGFFKAADGGVTEKDDLGTVTHIFSHLKHIYIVERLQATETVEPAAR